MNSLTKRAFAIFILLSGIVCICGMLLIRLFLPDAGFILSSRQLERKSEELVGNLRICPQEEASSYLRAFDTDQTGIFAMCAIYPCRYDSAFSAVCEIVFLLGGAADPESQQYRKAYGGAGFQLVLSRCARG